MSKKRRDTMQRLNRDPSFAKDRDERARARFVEDNDRLQRLANIAKRGCDVPGWLEAEWRALKQLKVNNREAAQLLGIAWLGETDDEADARWAAHRACKVLDNIIDRADLAADIGADAAYDLINMARDAKRILEWNRSGT